MPTAPPTSNLRSVRLISSRFRYPQTPKPPRSTRLTEASVDAQYSGLELKTSQAWAASFLASLAAREALKTRKTKANRQLVVVRFFLKITTHFFSRSLAVFFASLPNSSAFRPALSAAWFASRWNSWPLFCA